jgi:hypothetical protein
MKFSSLREISACEGTTSLPDQPSVAKASKINDCIAKTFEQASTQLFAPSSSAEINATRFAPLTTGSASRLGTIMLFGALTTRAPGARAATSWLVNRFPTFAGVKFPALPEK